MNSNKSLSASEQIQYDRCKAIIRSVPPVADLIGEPLWQVQTELLYRGEYEDIETFFRQHAKMQAEVAFEIIADWTQSPYGQEVISERSINNPDKNQLGEPSTIKNVQKPSTDASATVTPVIKPVTAADPGNPDAITEPASDQPILTRLKLSEITVDDDIQSRAAVNNTVVAEYAVRMKEGDKFPRIVVFNVNGKYLLSAGFHRYPAAVIAGLIDFPVEIRSGTRQDAIKFSIEANTTHGLPRTNKDKRRSVSLALTELTDLSDGLIAKLCRVSQPFVSKLRLELKTVMSCESKMGIDGKRRKQAKTRVSEKKQTQPLSDQATEDGTPPEAKKTENAEETNEAEKQHEKPATATGENAVWREIEDFLFIELEKCPQSHRVSLGQKLHQFADQNCH